MKIEIEQEEIIGVLIASVFIAAMLFALQGCRIETDYNMSVKKIEQSSTNSTK